MYKGVIAKCNRTIPVFSINQTVNVIWSWLWNTNSNRLRFETYKYSNSDRPVNASPLTDAMTLLVRTLDMQTHEQRPDMIHSYHTKKKHVYPRIWWEFGVLRKFRSTLVLWIRTYKTTRLGIWLKTSLPRDVMLLSFKSLYSKHNWFMRTICNNFIENRRCLRIGIESDTIFFHNK